MVNLSDLVGFALTLTARYEESIFDRPAPPQAAQALFMNHTRIQHNMASNYKSLYGVFYKITTKVVKSVNIQ